jgi:exodeoxyribonuclease-3
MAATGAYQCAAIGQSPMPLRIATWNVNSVRLRVDLIGAFLDTHAPDILCLQEIKCPADAFPAAAFRKRGFNHIAINGRKGYHGVAIVSKIPFLRTAARDFCGLSDGRHISVALADGGGEVLLHNFYVPAGGDEPDPVVNPKFAHKLAFLDEMHRWLNGSTLSRSAVLVGDLNVAPLEHDVWSHRQLLGVVSHTPVETGSLDRLRAAGSWIDAMRHFVPADRKLYTWWSYRARDWAASDRGRRLDHIWVAPALAPRLRNVEVVREARGWKQPSDHVPVIVSLAPVSHRPGPAETGPGSMQVR